MTATYDEDLSTSKDVVRLLIPDRTVASANFSDEEITAAIALQVNTFNRNSTCAPYFAAAELLRSLKSEESSLGGGLSRKKVEDLELEFGSQQDITDSILKRADRLEAQGIRCERLNASNRPRRFRVAGPRSRADET